MRGKRVPQELEVSNASLKRKHQARVDRLGEVLHSRVHALRSHQHQLKSVTETVSSFQNHVCIAM